MSSTPKDAWSAAILHWMQKTDRGGDSWRETDNRPAKATEPPPRPASRPGPGDAELPEWVADLAAEVLATRVAFNKIALPLDSYEKKQLMFSVVAEVLEAAGDFLDGGGDGADISAAKRFIEDKLTGELFT